MAVKKINENPKITDTIILEIETPDAYGCYQENPYKVDNVIIYYVERNFLGENYGEYTEEVTPYALLEKLERAKKDVCDDPSSNNIEKLGKIEGEVYSSSQRNTFYYKDRHIVKKIGNEAFPAWLSTDTVNASLKLVEYDKNGNEQFGRFEYEWDGAGTIREGDYFVCWTYTPLPAGEKLSAHKHFFIEGDGLAVSSLPVHVTPNKKYETLLERYLPEIYKYKLSDNDVTPETLFRFNNSVAKGFTFLEDMANQIIDLFDANALHESMLNYLSNTFSLKLRSDDPTLWRRQIKEAVPLFKQKGTLKGLKSAFSQAGMTLNSLTQYWQIHSPYTFEESFTVVDSPSFVLEKETVVLPINDNFALYLKREGELDYTEVSLDNVSFTDNDDGSMSMNWIGDTLSTDGLIIYQNDKIKIKYQYKEIPSNYEQSLEDYIRTLPLLDERSENDQEYPKKNWNIRLIDEKDPLFDILVPIKHPFVDPLIFGYIRTEFAYSENIYNADEYNGSIRPSYDVCNIDKDFIDPCGSCISSTYTVDVHIEELSNDRMLECQDILREYMPFHAQIYSIVFSGEVNDFIQSPVEFIEILITIDYSQFVLSGNSNVIFNRNLPITISNYVVTRDSLTEEATVLSGKLGNAYNDEIIFISPDQSIKNLGVNVQSHILEVLAPSANSGEYTIDGIDGSIARVPSPCVEPLDKSAFTFKLSNINYKNSITTITQNNLIKLTDSLLDLNSIPIKTQWDVLYTENYSGGSWKVLLPDFSATPYEIINIVNGEIIIDGDSYIGNTNLLSYSLLNDNDDIIETSETGKITFDSRGYVNLIDVSIVDIKDLVSSGNYLYYNNTEYLISEFDGNNFWIENYNDGDAVGVSIKIRKRLVNNGVGYFGYRGLRLTTFSDHESEFEIANGDNPPTDIVENNSFKENYMFKIGEDFYKIVSINKKEVVLIGRDQDWGTLSYGGTTVAYSMLHFSKKQVNVGFIVFDHLDRSGYDPVIREIYSTVDQNTAMVALSTPKSSGVQENISLEEGVSFIITTKDGKKTEGDL